MNESNNKLLDSSLHAIEQCQDALGEIASSCCMPERSPNMDAAFVKLQGIVTGIQQTYKVEKSAKAVIKNIGEFGSQIGFLYATCCTVEREFLYQDVFKQLNQAHGNLWEVIGVNH